MDPLKNSLSSKAPHVNGVVNGSSLDDEVDSWGADGDGEVMDTVDGTAAAEPNLHHRGSADKHKFNSYQMRTKQKVVTDFATVSKGSSAGAKPRAGLKQVLFSQGVSDKNPAPEAQGQLDLLKHNLEAFTVSVSLKWRWGEENQGTTLESNWTEIVHSHSTMTKVQRNQQDALWEFVHTELTYINKLLIIKDLVLGSLLHLHHHGFLLEVTPQLLFSNLYAIIRAHQLFWQEIIFPMLQEVRRTGKPFDPMRLEAGCLQFRKRFSSYKHYCGEEESTQEYARLQAQSNPHFLVYVQWVETHPQADRMRLGDMQAKPHQRITKYPLLLGAVLKTTTDSGVQQALRGMLSSVSRFLVSINDYMRFKDEELALSISAQRVEGYEVEGINEEIDKHVREVSRFDLTCPISGVGPEVIRKLLLEENLKIRGRKDNKLEVVALLFSDVLLMTKVQKKGERLKVIRPPLALDRTHCIALKDGSSFVLVEVGELLSVMNVYIFVTGTPNSCNTWVSTIDQAKETLKELREKEKKRLMDKWKIHQTSLTSLSEDNGEDEAEMIQQPVTPSEEDTFVKKHNDKPIKHKSVNGVLSSAEADEPYQRFINEMPFWQLQRPARTSHKLARKPFPPQQQQSVPGYEYIEMEVRGPMSRTTGDDHRQEETLCTEAQGAGFKKVQSAPNLEQHFIFDNAGQTQTKPHSLLRGEYPEIDYPINEDSAHNITSDQSPPAISRRASEVISRRQPLDSVSVIHERRSTYSIPTSIDLSEAEGFKDIKSPDMRRRRPLSTHQNSSHSSKPLLRAAHRSVSNNSSSNSDSDCSVPAKRNSVPYNKNTPRVLKLGSLRPHQGMFWTDRVSPDPQTFSEPELQDLSLSNKRAKVKTQRSASIPNIVLQERSYWSLTTGSVSQTYAPQNDCPPPSPLQVLLFRAKERDKETLKQDLSVKVPNMRHEIPPPSPLLSTTPSPSPSEWDRDTEWEKVELLRSRALSVSKGWKEQLVDEDDDDKRNSVMFSDGVNVDWTGWCFDDEEVMDHLQPGGEGPLEGINRTLAFCDLQEQSEHEDGECSQV